MKNPSVPCEDRQLVLVDSHVHFHDSFEREAFFDAAERNFQDAAATRDLGSTLGFLLLTEVGGDRFFRSLRQSIGRANASGWAFEATAEEDSLLGRRDDGASLVVVSGHQLATKEGLEVLALCCPRPLASGLETRETVEAVRSAGGLPTIPWGFGKWTGTRGRILDALLRDQEPSSIYLGDTSARWPGAPEPKLFAKAVETGVRILPGTDPFPFSKGERRVGSFGFFLDLTVDMARPAESLKESLRDPNTAPEPYGRGMTFPVFCRDQFIMQIRKRLVRR